MISRDTLEKSRIALAVLGGCVFLFFIGYSLINLVLRFMHQSDEDVSQEPVSTLQVDFDTQAEREQEVQVQAQLQGPTTGAFLEDFSTVKTVEESSTVESSTDDEWWVNSGAYFYQTGEIGRTVHGDLPQGSKWFEQYKRTSSDPSESGLHPQNIFRLLHQSLRTNLEQQVLFRVDANHFSASTERGESNGLLLFSRYVDEDNLYYAGVRVDGNIIVKKKLNGTYHTLLEEQYFNRTDTYDRESFPTLLPQNQFIGVRTRVQDVAGGVEITVFLDENNTGSWIQVGQVIDDGRSFGGAAITAPGHPGIRTDFMDVSFDDYSVKGS